MGHGDSNRPDSHTVEPYEVDNIVFDKNYQKGRYGGNQGSLRYNADAEKKQWIYEHILKKNLGKDMTTDELDKYFEEMNNTGCGYVALLNTVFVHFQGKEDEFEKTFGYPMYDKNGNLNYDALFADLYSTKNPDGSFSSSNQYSREKLIESFLKERGVKCDSKTNVNVTPANIDTMLYDGKQVIIAFHDGYMYPADGGRRVPIKGGHAMVITGVTEDGKYIVSSWGEKYYIDPSEKVTLRYTDDDGTVRHHTTSITYATVEYK